MANSAYPDQTPQNAAYEQGLQRLHKKSKKNREKSIKSDKNWNNLDISFNQKWAYPMSELEEATRNEWVSNISDNEKKLTKHPLKLEMDLSNKWGRRIL